MKNSELSDENRGKYLLPFIHVTDCSNKTVNCDGYGQKGWKEKKGPQGRLFPLHAVSFTQEDQG